MPEHYTDEQRSKVVAMRYRDHQRPAPWQSIAAAIFVTIADDAVERLLWGMVTGYPTTSNKPNGPRREALVWPQGQELCRAGLPWHKPEKEALQAALGGAGQQRVPAVDVDYIAQVLARTPQEVRAKWQVLQAGGIKRVGFGLQK